VKKYIILIYLLGWTALSTSQVYEEPPWLPPLPPPIEEYCGDMEKLSQPVVSYRISGLCGLTDIQSVGEYQFGTEQVKKEVTGLASKQMVRRFVSGNFQYFNEMNIELHRASQATAMLVCTMDMMQKRVLSAKIVRQRVLDENKTIAYDEPIILENNQLPNLGVFTYTSDVRYTINNCPEISR
jgi:hypothetical protein